MERGRRNVPKSLSTVYQQVKSWAYDLSRIYPASIPELQRPITGHIGVQNTKSTEVQRRNAPAPPHPGNNREPAGGLRTLLGSRSAGFPGQRRWTSVPGWPQRRPARTAPTLGGGPAGVDGLPSSGTALDFGTEVHNCRVEDPADRRHLATRLVGGKRTIHNRLWLASF